MSLSPTEEAINRGEPIRLYRSEFLEKPAEYMLQADDRDTIIELMRYGAVSHAIVPLTLDDSRLGAPRTRSFYRYDRHKAELDRMADEESRCECNNPPDENGNVMGHSDEVIGQIITVRPYYLREYMKDMGTADVLRASLTERKRS